MRIQREPISFSSRESFFWKVGSGFLVFVIAILAIVALRMMDGSRQPGKNGLTGNVQGIPTRKTALEEVFSVVGTVKYKNTDGLTIEALSDMNTLSETHNLTVRFDERTTFVRIILPKTILPEDTNLERRETRISAEDIHVDDIVAVVSATNIRDSTEFVAERVEVRRVR